MPRNRRIPSYRLHKASGQAIVVLDGRTHYLGNWNSAESRAECDRLVAEWLANGRRSATHQPVASGAAPTVAEVILAFWRHAEVHYRDPDGSPSGELPNLRVALRPLRALYGETPAREFGPLALRAVREEMVRSGLARSSVNARVDRIRRMFRWAASVELAPASVVEGLGTVAGLQKGRTPARETEPVRPVAADRVERTIPFLSAPVAAMVRIQLLTGMRPGEVCAMRGCDLTPGEPVWSYRPGTHKSAWRGKDREVAIGPRAVEMIRGFLREDPESYIFDPRQAVAAHHAARGVARRSKPTPSERARRVAAPGAGHRRRYSKASYRNAIARACDRAFPHPTLGSIPAKDLTREQRAELVAWRETHRWQPNQLRHAAGTSIRAMYGLEAAQAVLGHARADVTQVYAERDSTRARSVMGEVG